MKSFTRYYVGISMLLVVSLIYSRFLVSVSMLALLVLALVVHRDRLSAKVRQISYRPEVVGLFLVFLVIFLSGIQSSDTGRWIREVKMKLPFLILPTTMYLLGPVSQQMHRWIHQVLVGTVAVSTWGVLWTYFSDVAAMQRMISMGQSIPTPIDHIHYSIIVAYGAVSSVLLGITSSRFVWEKVVHFLVAVYLFVFLHFLSVRTGIVLCYAGIGMGTIWYIWRERQYVIGIVTMAVIIALPFAAYQFVPSFQQKVDYMRWDIQQYQQGKGSNYSDSERLMSYEVAADLIREKPILGHGIGDLRQLTTEHQIAKFGEREKYIYPHNQYLFILTGVGIVGAIFFFGGLLAPMVFAPQRNIFLIVIYAMLLLSFLVENTIQRAVITAFFLFFILLNYHLEREQ